MQDGSGDAAAEHRAAGWRQYNLAVLTSSFFCLFAAFLTMQGYVGTTLQPGLGFKALVLNYSIFLLALPAAPTVCERLGDILAMKVGALGYLCFVASLLVADAIPMMVLFAAVLMGLGASILWVAQGSFLFEECSTSQNQGSVAGIFWGGMQACGIFGPLVSYCILTYVGTGRYRNTGAMEEQMMYLVFTGLAAVSVLILFLLQPKVRQAKIAKAEQATAESSALEPAASGGRRSLRRTRSTVSMEIAQSLRDTMALLKDQNLRLLVPGCFFSGMELCFCQGEFFKLVALTPCLQYDAASLCEEASCQWTNATAHSPAACHKDTSVISLAFMVWGAGDLVGSLVLGLYSDGGANGVSMAHRRRVVVTVGAAAYIAALGLMWWMTGWTSDAEPVFNPFPQPGSETGGHHTTDTTLSWAVYLAALLFGVADAAWATQMFAAIAAIAPNESRLTFLIYFGWRQLGAIVGFAIPLLLPIEDYPIAPLIIQLVLATVAWVCFVTVEPASAAVWEEPTIVDKIIYAISDGVACPAKDGAAGVNADLARIPIMGNRGAPISSATGAVSGTAAGDGKGAAAGPAVSKILVDDPAVESPPLLQIGREARQRQRNKRLEQLQLGVLLFVCGASTFARTEAFVLQTELFSFCFRQGTLYTPLAILMLFAPGLLVQLAQAKFDAGTDLRYGSSRAAFFRQCVANATSALAMAAFVAAIYCVPSLRDSKPLLFGVLVVQGLTCAVSYGALSQLVAVLPAPYPSYFFVGMYLCTLVVFTPLNAGLGDLCKVECFVEHGMDSVCNHTGAGGGEGLWLAEPGPGLLGGELSSHGSWPAAHGYAEEPWHGGVFGFDGLARRGPRLADPGDMDHVAVYEVQWNQVLWFFSISVVVTLIGIPAVSLLLRVPLVRAKLIQKDAELRGVDLSTAINTEIKSAIDSAGGGGGGGGVVSGTWRRGTTHGASRDSWSGRGGRGRPSNVYEEADPLLDANLASINDGCPNIYEGDEDVFDEAGGGSEASSASTREYAPLLQGGSAADDVTQEKTLAEMTRLVWREGLSVLVTTLCNITVSCLYVSFDVLGVTFMNLTTILIYEYYICTAFGTLLSNNKWIDTVLGPYHLPISLARAAAGIALCVLYLNGALPRNDYAVIAVNFVISLSGGALFALGFSQARKRVQNLVDQAGASSIVNGFYYLALVLGVGTSIAIDTWDPHVDA